MLMRLTAFRYNKNMVSEIPEELRKRWAEKDRQVALDAAPEIAVIDLFDYSPELPVLESLPETNEEALPSHQQDVPLTPFTPFPVAENLKLHKTLSAGLGSINIATYEPTRLPKTGNH